MKKIIWLILILIIQASIVKRIDDKETSIITPNDTLLSTMGLFRMVLDSKSCSLRIEKFNSTLLKYSPYINCYTQYFQGGSCNYLVVKNGAIFTDNGTIYAKLSNRTYAETALVLDDTGVAQLEGIPAVQNASNPSSNAETLTLQGNRTVNAYIEPHNSFQLDQINNVRKSNMNNWTFTIQGGNLTVQSSNKKITRVYPFKGVTFN
jgi:hypothetical protein